MAASSEENAEYGGDLINDKLISLGVDKFLSIPYWCCTGGAKSWHAQIFTPAANGSYISVKTWYHNSATVRSFLAF